MVVSAILTVGIPIVASAVLQTLAPRQRFPSLKPGDLLKTAIEIQNLTRRGLTPRLAPNPFEPGGFLLGTRDQTNIEEIAFTLAQRKFFALTRAESAELFEIRQSFIDSFPGAAPSLPSAVPPPPLPVQQAPPQVVLGNPDTPAIDAMKSISCTSRATTLEALRRCQEGP